MTRPIHQFNHRGKSLFSSKQKGIYVQLSEIFLEMIKIRGAAHNRVVIGLRLRLNFIAIVGDIATRDQKTPTTRLNHLF